MEKFAEAFEAELKKLGFAIPAYMMSPGYIVGSLLAGIVINDMLKGGSIVHKMGPEVIKGEKGDQVRAADWVKKLLKKEPLEQPTKVVTTKKDVDQMVKDPKFGFLTRSALRDAAEKIIDKGTNAAVIRGEKRDYVILPKKVNPRVVEHEIGHLRDFATPEYSDPSFLRRLLAAFWKPTHEKTIMERERRAWKYAEPTPIAKGALKTYEQGFYKGRAQVLAPLVLGLLRKGVRSAAAGVR